jgi:hypothetical protein
MEAKTKRRLENGAQYDHLFPRANLTNKTEKRGATVKDTVRFIPKVVERTAWQTKNLADALKGGDTRETCKNIWNFCYKHIRYCKDEDGLEQIRSPARVWHDRFRGVDCDCYTTLISTVLTNLKIPHVLRITKYKQDHFQHIYPIVPTDSGDYITVDCVVDKFDKEEPFSEKQDTKMDLQYLDGLGGDNLSPDQNLGVDLEMEGLGKFNLKATLKKGLYFTNRANPATVMLRTGLLAAMKINMFKLGSMMKWAYLNEADAIKRGVNMNNWRKLVKIREKLENIFYTAGGKPENLKKAILTGRGNRDHSVSGLGYVPDADAHLLDEKMPLRRVLGEEMYHDENIRGTDEMQGAEDVEGLGEPFTAASIASATGALGIIAGLIKKIGAIFPKKDAASKDFETTDQKSDTGTGTEDKTNLPEKTEKQQKTPSKNSPQSQSQETITSDSGGGATGDAPQVGFWAKNKKWLKPTLFVAGGLTIVGGGIEYMHAKKKKEEAAKKKTTTPDEKPVSGTPKSKTRATDKARGRPKGSRNKKRQIKTLM